VVVVVVAVTSSTASVPSRAAVKDMIEELRINGLLASRLESVNSDDLNRDPTIPVSPVQTDAETQSTFFKAIDALLARSSAEEENSPPRPESEPGRLRRFLVPRSGAGIR
jgi:hypothetical protein